MVFMTIDRFLVVAFPLQLKSWNLKTNSKITVVISGIVSCVLGGISATRKTAQGPNKCINNPKFDKLSNISDTLTYTIVGYGLYPILVFIFTTLIAYQLFKQKRAREVMLQDSQSVNKNKEFLITLMLFLVACMFLISKIFQITVWYLRSYLPRDSSHFQHASIAMPFARILIIPNHSLNSLVYIFFLKKFREAMLCLICCCRKNCERIEQPEINSHSTGSTRF